MNQIIPVSFYNDSLAIVDHDGQPFVPMRPIVANMGLAWQSQHPKLTDKFGSTVMIIMTVGEDGKDREMVCLPLRKIPAWLYSINPNKVDPAIRSKVIQYQEECDDVLWRYWITGSATRASEKHERAARQDSFRRAATIARIDSMKNPALQRLALCEIGIDPAVLGPLDNQPDFFHQ